MRSTGRVRKVMRKKKFRSAMEGKRKKEVEKKRRS